MTKFFFESYIYFIDLCQLVMITRMNLPNKSMKRDKDKQMIT